MNIRPAAIPGLVAAWLLLGLAPPALASPADPTAASPAAAKAAAYWTKDRRAAAKPRDLRIDARGLGYMRRPDGRLVPYGHLIAAQASDQPKPAPRAKPGSGDTTPPSISNMVPNSGATIGSSFTFSATVTDTSGVKSVSIVIHLPGGATQSFAASRVGTTNQWSAGISGFTDGSWGWHVVAKDNATPSNTKTSPTVSFTVDTGGGGGGGGGDTVTNAQWTDGGDVQTAVGRIYFEMPSNSRLTRWSGYVCSGTVATDNTSGRSVIITASHCVYDDAYKAFARNVLFIPNQAGGGSPTDLNCNNDPYGCWSTAFGVVDVNWTTRTFPENVAWDYAFYVVSDSSAHSGTGNHTALDGAVASLLPSFAAPKHDTADATDYTHALGYSYSEDPNFMYCAEDMETESAADWWLPSCDLSGGSSGGPWVQPMGGGGSGPIISVNSWGYTNQPGMAGPVLSGTSASSIFACAKSIAFASVPTTDGKEGRAVTNLGTCN